MWPESRQCGNRDWLPQPRIWLKAETAARKHVQKLAQAVEVEVAGWIDSHAHVRDEAGHREIVRNGSLAARTKS